jgi:purine nucleosidase
MAGAFAVEGKAAGGADFNSWSDAEALARVLERGVMPRIVPLDVSAQVTLTAQAMAEGSTACGSPLSVRLNKAMGPYMAFHRQAWGIEAACHPHDAVVAASLVAPSLFAFEPARLRVMTDGEHLGRIERIEGEPNAELCVGVDAAAVEALLLARLFCAPALNPA